MVLGSEPQDDEATLWLEVIWGTGPQGGCGNNNGKMRQKETALSFISPVSVELIVLESFYPQSRVSTVA